MIHLKLLEIFDGSVSRWPSGTAIPPLLPIDRALGKFSLADSAQEKLAALEPDVLVLRAKLTAELLVDIPSHSALEAL